MYRSSDVAHRFLLALYRPNRYSGDLMNPHLTDILAIIEGGVRGDPARVRTYAEELAKKIAEDGDRPAAERIRRAAASPKSMVAAAAATAGTSAGTPTDGESRLPLAD